MDDLKLKKNELAIKLVATILTLLTIIIGLWRYFHGISHENYMEFKRNVWQQQLETYTMACKYAGLLAMNPDSKDFEKNKETFGGLYWGEMILVEDTVVRDAMKDFYFALVYDFEPNDKNSRNKLKYKAEQLAEACKMSSTRTWNTLKPKN